MDEKTKLLEQLRIDRGTSAQSGTESRRSVPIWVVYALLLVIVAGISTTVSWIICQMYLSRAQLRASFVQPDRCLALMGSRVSSIMPSNVARIQG